MKAKEKKAVAVQPEHPTKKKEQGTLVADHPLLGSAQALVEGVAAQRAYDQRYFDALALHPEDTTQYAQIANEAFTLKEAARHIRQAQRETEDLADEVEARLQDAKVSQSGHFLNRNRPTNATIDMQEQKKQFFAQGINFYKLFWVLFIGSFAGVVVETIWCYAKNGYIASRAGLVYGPFNLVYGLGALVLTMALYRFRNRGNELAFVSGMLVGSVVEYACSWFQEMMFGSTSWDYSNIPFNLNGRICLLYSFFWGFLGILWIKNIYPRMAQLLLKIPNRVGKVATYVLLAFLIFDSVMSLLAVDRWNRRVHDVPAQSVLGVWLDEHFPDTRMERIFENLEFKK